MITIFVWLFVCLFGWLFVCLFVCLFICLSDNTYMIIKWSTDNQHFQDHKMISLACFFVCFWSDDHQMINRWSRDQSICVLQCWVLYQLCIQCHLCNPGHAFQIYNAIYAGNAFYAMYAMPIVRTIPLMQYTQCQLCM